jgi:GT2 family glycosyltransferase
MEGHRANLTGQLEASEARVAEFSQKLKASEADRTARLEVINQLDQRVAELFQKLKASEADRASRLKVINQLDQRVAELSQELKASEADRAARLKAINQLNQRLDESETDRSELSRGLEVSQAARKDLAQKLETSEADRQARLELIYSLQRQIAELATTRASLKRVAAAVVRRLRIYSFLKKHQQLCERIYDVLFRIVSRAKEVTPAKEVSPVAPLDSPQVEAFIVARTLEGEIDDRGLAHLFEMGSQLKHVLCPHPTAAAVQAVYMLAKAGVRVTCTGARDWSADLQSCGVTAITYDLARWMIEAEHYTLADFDGLILDTSTDKNTLRSLEGRLSRTATVLILDSKGEDFRLRSSWRKPEQQIGNLQIYEVPPDELLDPVQKNPEWRTLKDWPCKQEKLKLPDKLPSGRPWPMISIVTVTYNQGEYLEEALRSVLMQGYPNLEYLVLDGLSTDHSPSILSRYRKDLAYYISEKDKGQSDALNKGLSRATGDILAWLNSDDRYLPDTLVRVALAFDAWGADMVAGGCALVRDKNTKPFTTHHNSIPLGRMVPLPLNRLLDIEGCWLKGDFFWQPEVFWTRSIWERSGGRVAEDLYYSMDYDLWVRMARAGATIVHIPDTLAIYRMHEGQKTSGEELPYLPELRQVSGEYLKGLK